MESAIESAVSRGTKFAMINLLNGRTAGGGASASRGLATQYRRRRQHTPNMKTRSGENNCNNRSQTSADVIISL
jgi:hypothetical protein